MANVWIDDFEVRNSEFTDRDGNVLGAGWLCIDLSGDGERFEIESVRYVVMDLTGKLPERLKKVPTHIADFIADWMLADLANGEGSLVRQAYIDALNACDESREDDRAEWGVQFLSAAE